MKNSKTIIIALLLMSMGMASYAGKTSKIIIKTSGICGTCKEKIEKTVNAVSGVSSSYFNTANASVTVKYDGTKTNPDAIRNEISKVGYSADNVAAVKSAYDALPKCCQKAGGECKH